MPMLLWLYLTTLLYYRASASCIALAEALRTVSHDRLTSLLQRDWSVQTFLDLACRMLFVWELGYLIFDDSVILKPFATPIEGLARTLRQVKAADLIHENQVRLCVIGDGPPGSWKQVHERFPSAVEILYDYHCSEHPHKVASLKYGNRPPRQPERCEATVAWLLWGEVRRRVIWGLQRSQSPDAQAAEVIDELIGYLQRYQERVDYGFARKGGYTIGSSSMESANKFVCHVRHKRSGEGVCRKRQ